MSEHPKVAVPAARSRLSSLKVRRRLVFGLLIGAAAAGLISAMAWLTYSPPATEQAADSATPAVALATQVAREYLAGVPTTVSYATGVDPTFGFTAGETKPFPVAGGPNVASVTATDMAGRDVTLVRYYVALDQQTPVKDTATGATTTEKKRFYYQLTVPMIVPTIGTPVLAATPTLQPFVGTPPKQLDGMDPNALPEAKRGNDLPSNVVKQVNAWANTFAAAGVDSEQLQLLTKDDNPEHKYSGLGEWTVAGTPEVVGALPAPVSENPDDPNPGGWIVRTRLVLTPPAGNGPSVQSEYDVWVAGNGDDAQPPVIAWAPAGSYDLMQPYMNARTVG